MLTGDHIAITLFEDQLIRNYFSGGQDSLICRIVQKRRVTFFTSRENQNLVNKLVKDLGIAHATVCEFDATKGGLFYKILSFLLRWSIRSGTVYVSIQRDKSFRFIARRVVYIFTKFFPYDKNLIRYLFLHSLSRRKLAKAFHLNASDLFSIESIFVTSLTNLYQDIPVAMYFRRCGRRVVGTVRSWDNLTSHGALHFVPDEFLSHSPWISHAALEFQKISPDLLRSWVSPSHENRFLSDGINRAKTGSKKRIRVLYASMGLETNPDDQNMINWICRAWTDLPKNFELTILQHPKFILWPEKLNERISNIRFDYSTSDLRDYYNFLLSHDLVIGGGTSVILDSTFAKIPIVLTKFEIVSQDYWKSHLRYFDHLDHTKTLFNMGNYVIVESQSQLLATILKQSYRVPKLAARDFFLWSEASDTLNLR